METEKICFFKKSKHTCNFSNNQTRQQGSDETHPYLATAIWYRRVYENELMSKD